MSLWNINDRRSVATNSNANKNAATAPRSTNQLADPNITDPHLCINGACVYERHLPGNVSIMANVQRLQHGYYSSPALVLGEFDNVDFLALNFVFHAPRALRHRFRAATIRASVTNREALCAFPRPERLREAPRFLMHAPHLIYGAVSPDNLQWTFNMAGSMGVTQLPISASFVPSRTMKESYRRYEMLRIQGSVRTLRSPWGSQFDVEAGEIVWSLEENNVQRSGLPREFTFVMLVHKPRADSDIVLTLDVKPEIQAWIGRFPQFWLSRSTYQPVCQKSVDFKRPVGQRFEPSRSVRGFNFAALGSSFEDYVSMPGSTYSSSKLSPDGVVPTDNAAGAPSRELLDIKHIPVMDGLDEGAQHPTSSQLSTGVTISAQIGNQASSAASGPLDKPLKPNNTFQQGGYVNVGMSMDNSDDAIDSPIQNDPGLQEEMEDSRGVFSSSTTTRDGTETISLI